MPAPRARLASWATALCVLIAPDLASADIPIGSFEFELGGVNSLWMGGDEDTHEDADGFCASFAASFDLIEACDYGLYVDGRGKIDGHAAVAGLLGGNRIAIEGPIKGSQRGDNRSGITRALFQIRLAGSASRGSAELGTSATLAYDVQLDAGGALNGTRTQTVCYEGFPCTTSHSPAGPATWSNGHWTLALDVEYLGGGTLGGVAQIRFGDDSICDFTIHGRYNAIKDAASLALSAVSPQCEGGSLRLQNLTKRDGGRAEAYVAQLRYKLFGVSGTTVVETGITALYRVLGAYYHDPINQPLPPPQTGSSSSGVSIVMTVVQMPSAPLLQPTASSSAAASEIAAAEWNTILNLVSAQQGAGAPPASAGAAAGLEIEEMGFSALLDRPASANVVLPGLTPLAP